MSINQEISPTGRRGVCIPVDQLCLLWIVLTSYLFQTLASFHECNRVYVCSTATSLKKRIDWIYLCLALRLTAVHVFQLFFPLGKVNSLKLSKHLDTGTEKISFFFFLFSVCAALLPEYTLADTLAFCSHFRSLKKNQWLVIFWMVSVFVKTHKCKRNKKEGKESK